MALNPQKLGELKAFIAHIKANPNELHNPALSFFKEYLEQGGFRVPPKHEPPKEEPKKEEKKPEPKKEEPKKEEHKPAAAAPEEPEEEDTDIIPADHDAPQAMGSDKEPSDDDVAKASQEKAAAMEAQGNGNFVQAVAHFTAAINANSKQAMLFALRGNAYLSLRKPNAAIRDCDHAIKLNPDSAKAFKVRGKAFRALGKYEEALKDLGTGQRIDFDEGSVELIKFLEQKVAKRRERNRKKEEAEKKRRDEEAAAKAKAHTPDPSIYDDMPEMEDIPGGGAFPGMGGMPGGFPGMGGAGGMGGGAGGMGGMPPGMDKIFNDPEVIAMMQDPEVMAKLSKVMSGGMPNPAELASDPKLAKLFTKFAGARGGM